MRDERSLFEKYPALVYFIFVIVVGTCIFGVYRWKYNSKLAKYNELYENMKDYYSVSIFLDKIDNKRGPLKFDDFMDVMIDKSSEKDPETEMKKAFKILCEEGTDKITLKSLSKICADLGEKISNEELQEMINEADKDQDEEVGEEDFIKIMQKTGMF